MASTTVRVRNVVGALAVIAGVGALLLVRPREVSDHQPCTKIAMPSYVGMSREELVNTSAAIVVGTVVSVHPRYVRAESSCDDIYSLVRVRTEKDLGGQDDIRPQYEYLYVYGGKIGPDESRTEGESPYVVGQKNLLFLFRSDSFRKHGGWLTPMAQGRYTIDNDERLGASDLEHMFLREIWGEEHPTLEAIVQEIRQLQGR